MLVFDAPTRDICTVNRQQTNTPLQALVLLNDPQQLEAARKLAEIGSANGSTAEFITSAYRRVLSRAPASEEVNSLEELYQEVHQEYSSEPNRADSLLAIGESLVPESQDKVALAARTILASTILNLNETITRP